VAILDASAEFNFVLKNGNTSQFKNTNALKEIRL
jgi:hypothetical protein